MSTVLKKNKKQDIPTIVEDVGNDLRTMSIQHSGSDDESSSHHDYGGGGNESDSDVENQSSGWGTNTGGSTSGNSSSNEDDMDIIESQLTEKKSRAVNRLRACVVLVLVLASLGVSITVYMLSRKADVEAFEIQYEGNVDKILDAFTTIFTEHVGAISGLANAATAHSADHSTIWPYQTLSNFHGRAGNARKLSRALHISSNHIIQGGKQELKDWETYVLSPESNIWM